MLFIIACLGYRRERLQQLAVFEIGSSPGRIKHGRFAVFLNIKMAPFNIFGSKTKIMFSCLFYYLVLISAALFCQ